MSSYDPNSFTAPPPGGGNLAANVPGRIALIAGVALILLQVTRWAVFIASPFSPSGGRGAVQALELAFGVGEVLLALAAIIFGAVGLGGRARPRGAAAAGLALGASSLLFTLLTLSRPLFF